MRMRQGYGDSWWCPAGHWTHWNYCPQHRTPRPTATKPPRRGRVIWVAVAAVILLVGAGVEIGLRLSSGGGDASSNLELAIQAKFPDTQAECEHRSGPEY